MSKIARMADRLLERFVPQRTAAAATCTTWYAWSMCYCKGGLRYSRRCTWCDPFYCCNPMALGCPQDTGCIVVGTC
ncbi:hypothetical protein [Rhizomonospora bruguierae]|uniref:hypothetical protein n=1 Tax=Rhizomonospora bruguierae TaxID=1581705 RepID=UPI001BCD686F|nr:hypothetical protein [Micromonospora sp. NBRC 107566]